MSAADEGWANFCLLLAKIAREDKDSEKCEAFVDFTEDCTMGRGFYTHTPLTQNDYSCFRGLILYETGEALDAKVQEKLSWPYQYKPVVAPSTAAAPPAPPAPASLPKIAKTPSSSAKPEPNPMPAAR